MLIAGIAPTDSPGGIRCQIGFQPRDSLRRLFEREARARIENDAQIGRNDPKNPSKLDEHPGAMRRVRPLDRERPLGRCENADARYPGGTRQHERLLVGAIRVRRWITLEEQEDLRPQEAVQKRFERSRAVDRVLNRALQIVGWRRFGRQRLMVRSKTVEQAQAVAP